MFDERKLHTIFGGVSDHFASSYILFYERTDRGGANVHSKSQEFISKAKQMMSQDGKGA